MKKKLKSGAQLIAIKSSKKKQQQQQQQHEELIKNAQKSTLPCGKSYFELEEYVKNNYDAIELELTEQREYSLKMMIILNKVLEQPVFNNIEEIEKFDHDERRNRAKKMMDEGIELDYVVYRLNKINKDGNPIEIAFERKYEYLNLHNGSRDFWNELMVEYGVFEEDIRTRSPRFIWYVLALEDKKKQDE